MDFKERFDLLRGAIMGPLKLRMWAQAAGVAEAALAPGYPSNFRAATLQRLVSGAAKLLELDEQMLSEWLDGGKNLDLEAFLQRTRDSVACGGCGKWFEKATREVHPRLGRCKACQRSKMRDESADRYSALLAEHLPEIELHSPDLAAAVVVARRDPSRALTMTRLSAESGLPVLRVNQILAGLGLAKRTLKGLLAWMALAGTMTAQDPADECHEAIRDTTGPKRRTAPRRTSAAQGARRKAAA